MQVQRICVNELIRRHQAKNVHGLTQDENKLIRSQLGNVAQKRPTENDDDEFDLTLDDVVVALENIEQALRPGEQYQAHRNERWALNIRRRVYDCLNILSACDYLTEPEQGYFDFSVLGKQLLQ